jgi:sugar O-acyltransferase (sialic acid O-acetyltransferase NeuD family)
MAKIVIFGCGKGADTAYRYISRDSPHKVCAFAVDSAYLLQDSFHSLPIVPYETVVDQFPPAEYEMFVPLGFQTMNAVRAARYLDAKLKGYRFISYVHSRAYSLEPLRVGENCFILEHQSFNLDVAIGNNVTIWSGSHIGDRSVVRDHAWISSHVTISGDVVVGEGCFLGVSACVSNGVTLGPRTFVGANTLIARNTAESSVHVAPPSVAVGLSSEKFLAMLRLS